MNRVLLTVTGAVRLKQELKDLKSTERPRIIEAIAEARAHGDLSENAEYDAAKDEQGFIEGRIAELEGQLAQAEIIDPTKINANGKVVFGAFVTLYDIETEKEVRYQLVGDLEANLDNGQVSVSSPIGRALVGKVVDDEVEVKAPAGVRIYEVVDITYE